MTTKPRLMTAEDLERLPEDHMRHELVEGELRTVPPAGHTHGSVAMTFGAYLATYVREKRLGRVFAAETGFVLATNPDTVRAPDVAFVASERLALITRAEGFFPGPPDLAVEVVSPGDLYSEVEEKVKSWLGSGARLVIVADPRTKTVKVHRGPNNIQTLTQEDTLDGGEVVPGWALPWDALFSTL